MKLGRIMQATLIVVAAFMLVGSASASSILWNDNGTGTEFTSFVGGSISTNGLVLTFLASGETFTLTFVPNPSSANSNATGSNVDYGDFILSTASTSTTAVTFPAFSFNLVVDDLDGTGGTGIFTGSSVAASVSYSSSSINITWSPGQVGPGTSGASTGTFGVDYFIYPSNGKTGIVAPNSNGGDTTIQGTVYNNDAIPEPATMAMVGGLLLGLGGLARKRRA